MAHGDPIPSPWLYEARDYVARLLTIRVDFSDATGDLADAIIHRDDGCLYTKIVFDDPTNNQKAKRLTAPTDGQSDVTYTAQQMRSQQLQTITDVRAIQVTAEF